MPAFARSVVDACREAIATDRTVGLHEPTFDGTEWARLKACIDSGWVSTAGPQVTQFEEALSARTEVRHAVATNSGTAALHVALLLAGVRPGDEVLMPALTFVATANAVAYCGGMPHFVDCDESTLGLDPHRLASYLHEVASRRDDVLINRLTGRPIRALLPMHTFGHPTDLGALVPLAARWDLALVEDAAEALGSRFEGRHVGGFGCTGVLSFNGNKIATTGAGGALLTNDPALAARARHLTTTARVKAGHHVVHDEIGFNYRMASLNAALGVAQLDRLETLLALKRALAARYHAAFESVDGVTVFRGSRHAEPNYWLTALLLDRPDERLRDELVDALDRVGIGARPAWTPLHRLPMYRDCPRMNLAVTESLAARIITLPSGAALGAARVR